MIQEIRNELRISNNAIKRIIENGIDEDGVLSEEASKALEEHNEKQEVILTGVIEGMNGYKTLADVIKSKIDRLKNLEKYYRNTENSLKNLAKKIVPEGENFNTEDFAISWRKSSYLNIDILADLNEVEKKHPEAVKIEKSFNKVELKKLIKNGVKLNGIELRTRQNMQIK